MRAYGLATKITVPFVLLIAGLLALFTAVLAHELFDAVERSVIREQTFVLKVTMYPAHFPSASYLRAIRDRSTEIPSEQSQPSAKPELIVHEAPEPPVSTWNHQSRAGAKKIQAFMQFLNSDNAKGWRSEQPGQVRQGACEIEGERYLVLHAFEVPGASKRDYYLLYPRHAIEEAQHRAVSRVLLLGAGGLVLATLLGCAIAYWISHPVRKLATAATQVAQSGLEVQTELPPPTSGDELGELTVAFNRMVASLRHSQEELLKAARLAATGKLAASVAHEIRNPLTSIRMTIQVLADRFLPRESGSPQDEKTRQAYKLILDEIDRLSLTIDELLTFARPRPPQRAPTDLNLLLTQTLALMQRQMQHAKIEVELHLDGSLPKDLPLDANKIKQLAINLLLNALQAIVRNGKIVVGTRWHGSQAELFVSDNGPGIPVEIRSRIFDPFVSSKSEGGGLGLAVARQIVEEHNGTIEFETSNTGTCFKVRFEDKPALQGGF